MIFFTIINLYILFRQVHDIDFDLIHFVQKNHYRMRKFILHHFYKILWQAKLKVNNKSERQE